MYLKRYITVLFIIPLLVVGCKPSVKDGLSYEEYIKMVETYLNDSDYDRAIAAGKKAVSIKPTDGETHYFLARQYYEAYRNNLNATQMKGLQDAILHPDKQRNSDRMEELKKYGFKPELETFAFQEFNETVKYSPNNWFARYMIATDAFNKKHFVEAIDEYKKVIAINPNYANAHGLMGESYYKLGDFKSAVLSLETAVKLDPGVENYLQLGLAYKRINNKEKYAAIVDKLKSMDKGRYDKLVSNLN
jgi:tetratricopeptide (TPR) repeat protein